MRYSKHGEYMKRLLYLLLSLTGVCYHPATAQENFVDPFDGTVSYSVPLLPGVTLRYSSSFVPTMMTSENRDVQTSWLGAGWTFGMGAIEADLNGTTTTDDDE